MTDIRCRTERPGKLSLSGTEKSWLLVGASGRVGRLVSGAWGLAPRPVALLRQLRAESTAADAVAWSPLEGPAALLDQLGDRPPVAVMLVLAGIVPSGRQPDFSQDARIADACIAAAAESGIRRCLVASSAAVYGTWPGLAPNEDDTPNPVTPYGRGKLATEEVCRRWRAQGMEVGALRIGNVAGADALLGQAPARLAKGLRLDRFPDGGGPVRSYIDPLTLADVLCSLALTDDLPAVLNVAAPGAVAMSDLLGAAGVPWQWTPAPEGAVRRMVLDCDRLASIHAFPSGASDPHRLVAGWHAARLAA